MTKFPLRMLGGIAIAGLAMAGCGSPKDANEANFGNAIRQHLQAAGDLCLRSPYGWPVEVGKYRDQTAKQMEALVATGLVREGKAEPDSGADPQAKLYELTDQGMQFARDGAPDVSVSFGDAWRSIGGKKPAQKTWKTICYGKKSLLKVVKWEGPVELGEFKMAQVKYLYKIEGLASWATNSDIRTAFPEIARMVDRAEKDEQVADVVLTSAGWEVKAQTRLQ